MKKTSVMLLFCLMLTACSAVAPASETGESLGNSMVSSTQTIIPDSSVDNDETDSSVVSVPVQGMEDIPAIDTWKTYECEVGDITLAFKLPDFLL